LIRSGDAGSAVNDEENERRAIDCNLSLLEDALWDFSLLSGEDTPGIYNFVGTPKPSNNSVDSISRDARLICDDGSALPDQPIEQRGFSNVRASDDCN
jgi:hypothetical protein